MIIISLRTTRESCSSDSSCCDFDYNPSPSTTTHNICSTFISSTQPLKASHTYIRMGNGSPTCKTYFHNRLRTVHTIILSVQLLQITLKNTCHWVFLAVCHSKALCNHKFILNSSHNTVVWQCNLTHFSIKIGSLYEVRGFHCVHVLHTTQPAHQCWMLCTC